METTSFKNLIARLTKGLLFGSESDYPWALEDLGIKTQEEVQVFISSRHNNEPTIEVEVDAFFTKYIQNRITSGDDLSLTDAGRYALLQHCLKKNADSITVCRCGRIQVGVYIVISLADNQTLVLMTTSIET